ncbi:MAG TPA: ABC transporter permease [Thermoanaerobaculia bacterium]|jgi:putative ABC transport system permease protein|nr:ABC transporter permease [Thermoanaerobaculia bacterium]
MNFLLDARLAIRSLIKRPGAALVMILTLAVGLGVNAAIFGVLDRLVLRPFVFPDVDRLVLLSEKTAREDFDKANVAPANFFDFQREAQGILENLVAYSGWNANLIGADGPEKVLGTQVSPDLFRVLRVEPALGRFFLAAKGTASSAPVDSDSVVISDSLWRRLGTDSGIIGRPLSVNDHSYQVIGVARPGFNFPEGTEIWSTLVLSPEEAASREDHYLGAFGRLAPGVTLATAAARFEVVAASLRSRYPDTNAGRGALLETLTVGLQDAGTPSILGLWQAAAGFVLLIAWVNLANLMLARGSERQRDLAVLEALGASRSRRMLTLLAEGAFVAIAGALLSLPIAALAIRVMRDAMPASIRKFIYGWERLGLDGRIFAFTLGLALFSVLAFSVWPALRSSGSRLGGALRQDRRGGSGVGAQRGRSVLVIVEVAAGLVLLVSATLCVRGANRLLHGPQGYDPDRLLMLRTTLVESRYADDASRRAFARAAIARLSTLPGVESVAAANLLPATGNNNSYPVAIAGEPEPDKSDPPQVDGRMVSSRYFETLGMPILAGRGIAASDGSDSLPVAVISRSMAERYWPGRDPLGKKFRAGEEGEPWLTVVGVAGDHIHQWFTRRNYPTFFQPLEQKPRLRLTFAIKTRGEPEAMGREVRKALIDIDPYQPIYDVSSMRRSISEATIGLQYAAAVMAAFAFFGVILAVSGVYAVMAYRINLRRQEIGVRVALGATKRDVLGLTLGQALRLTAIGLAAGAVLSAFAGQAIAGLLRGVAEVDLRLIVFGIVLLGGAMLLAAFVPTRRALAVDPAEVLRNE